MLEAIHTLRVHSLERVGACALDDGDVVNRVVKDAGRVLKHGGSLHAAADGAVLFLAFDTRRVLCWERGRAQRGERHRGNIRALGWRWRVLFGIRVRLESIVTLVDAALLLESSSRFGRVESENIVMTGGARKVSRSRRGHCARRNCGPHRYRAHASGDEEAKGAKPEIEAHLVVVVTRSLRGYSKARS